MTIRDQIEPSALGGPDVSFHDEIGVSIAISLKRIADVLDINLGHNATAHEGTLLSILNHIEMNGRR